MKVAVVFAGQPRLFRKTFQSHLDFFNIEGYDFDYFIHAWSDQWYRNKTHSEHDYKNEIIENPEELKNELKNIYKPKKIIVENQKKCEDLLGDINALIPLQKKMINRGGTAIKWLDEFHMGQIYSWQKATNLIWGYEEELGFKYDLIIRFRLDNLLYNHNDGEKRFFMEEIKEEKDHRPAIRFQGIQSTETGLFNVRDMIFGGPRDTFKILMQDIYIFLLKEICKSISNMNNEWIHPGSPETILGKKISFNKIRSRPLTSVKHLPYREYHLSSEKQDFVSLRKVTSEADEGRLKGKR